jgi:hypothetical protein
MERAGKTASKDRSSSPEAQRVKVPMTATARQLPTAHEQNLDQIVMNGTVNAEKTKLDGATPQAKTGGVLSQPNDLLWTWRRPHFDGYDPTRPTEETSRKRTVVCMDITESKWVQDPEDPYRETVYLTSDPSSLQEAADIATSFCWT